jgi:Protein of unknown function (DUF3616)
MKRFCMCVWCSMSLVFVTPTVEAQAVRSDGIIELQGDVAYPEELSGVALWSDLIVVCPDEGAQFNVFKHIDLRFELVNKVNLLVESEKEIDMEGAASDAEHVYIVGSHSIRRRRIDEEGTYKKNRKRLTRTSPHTESYSLYRLKLNHDGALIEKERVDLRDVLEADEVLGAYFAVPGKENGIDIEGVAVKDRILYVGFRGPVLRGNFVPVIAFKFEQPHDYELRFVQLEGRGIRDIVAVNDGFLILAGAVGDGDSSYKLYLWNGQDCVPGDGGREGLLSAIGELATNLGVKPEGVVVTSESADEWRLLVVSDGNKDASSWVVQKPNQLRRSE